METFSHPFFLSDLAVFRSIYFLSSLLLPLSSSHHHRLSSQLPSPFLSPFAFLLSSIQSSSYLPPSKPPSGALLLPLPLPYSTITSSRTKKLPRAKRKHPTQQHKRIQPYPKPTGSFFLRPTTTRHGIRRRGSLIRYFGGGITWLYRRQT